MRKVIFSAVFSLCFSFHNSEFRCTISECPISNILNIQNMIYQISYFLPCYNTRRFCCQLACFTKLPPTFCAHRITNWKKNSHLASAPPHQSTIWRISSRKGVVKIRKKYKRTSLTPTTMSGAYERSSFANSPLSHLRCQLSRSESLDITGAQ